MLQEFQDFIFRGNALALAIGVLVAGAFGKVVDSVVTHILNPIIAGIVGGKNMDGVLAFPLGNPTNILSIGAVIGALISFVATMAVLFIIARTFAKDALKKE